MAYKQKGWTPFTQLGNKFNWKHGPMRGPNPARGQKRRKAWSKFKSGVKDFLGIEDRASTYTRRGRPFNPRTDPHITLPDGTKIPSGPPIVSPGPKSLWPKSDMGESIAPQFVPETKSRGKKKTTKKIDYDNQNTTSQNIKEWDIKKQF